MLYKKAVIWTAFLTINKLFESALKDSIHLKDKLNIIATTVDKAIPFNVTLPKVTWALLTPKKLKLQRLKLGYLVYYNLLLTQLTF